MFDLLKYNREAWENEVRTGNKWTVPVSSDEIAEVKSTGKPRIFLTPTKMVPESWLETLKGKKVLCLASGGGQQGPLLAAAGAEVTVFDNCPAQLEKDIAVACRDRLSLKTKQGDMRDLSCFPDETFDLIVHPVSNCFVDNVRVVWKEAYRVLKCGGILISGFNNPNFYIFDLDKWDKEKVYEVKYKIPYSDVEHLPKDQLAQRQAAKEPMEWAHTLADQIGGQTDVGFHILGFYEDNSGWGDLLDSYIDTFIATKAKKPCCKDH
jgi:ubiquinone/menaquinone biosynthesis C-methylase UbiE